MRKFLAIALLAIVLIPAISNAQLTPADSGLTDTGSRAYGGTPQDIGTYVGNNIIGPAFSLVGVIFLVLVVYSGFLWMTAAGDSARVDKAKNILVSTIVGTVIIAGAYVIVLTVFQALL